MSEVRAAEGRTEARLVRFDGVERAVHWATAALVLALIVTGAMLYVPALERSVGERALVERIHVVVGLCLPLPLLLGALGRWGRRLRADLGRLDRISPAEWRWLRRFGRSEGVALGKFNPGQKLNAGLLGGSLVALFVTGLVLHWAQHLPLVFRTGATFVHDLVAWVVVVLVVGHIVMALAHPGSLRSMVVGWVDERWAARHAPAWQAARPAREPARADWRPEPEDAYRGRRSG